MKRKNHIFLACFIMSMTTLLSNHTYAQTAETEPSVSEMLDTSSEDDERGYENTSPNVDDSKIKDAENSETKNDIQESFEEDLSQVDKSTALFETEERAVRSIQDTTNYSTAQTGTSSSTRAVVSNSPEVERIWGNNRIQTANEVALKHFRDATRVVLVNSTAYVDALSAGNVTDGKAPILYTKQEVLPTDTLQTIQKIAPNEVFLIGGEGVISSGIENMLKRMRYQVTRIGGESRYDTNIETLKSSTKKNVVLVTGTNFPDGLAVTPFAQAKNANIILTRTNFLHPTTGKYLKSKKGTIHSLTVIGGPEIVSDGAVQQAENYLGIKGTRIYGSSRYDTSVKIAQFLSKDKMIFVTGENPADALVAGPYAQKYQAPIILVNNRTLSNSIKTFLKQQQGKVRQLIIIGGTGVVSDQMKNQVLSYLKAPAASGGETTTIPVSKDIFVPYDFVMSTNPLNLYEEKGKTSAILVTVPKNARVRVVKVSNDGWILLSYNNIRGYSLPVNCEKFDATKDPDIFAKGVDVSRYNYTNDFVTAKKNGIDFVIVRAGSGWNGGYIDPYFERNYRDAKAARLGVGAYWYTYAMNVKDAVKEADMFLSALRGKQFDYPVYLDFEDPSQSKLTKKEKTDIAIAFMDRLEKNGYYTGLYSMGSWLNDAFETERLEPYDKWIAHWGTDQPRTSLDYGMWQYTNKGAIKGITKAGEEMDVNFSYVNYPSIIKRARLNNY